MVEAEKVGLAIAKIGLAVAGAGGVAWLIASAVRDLQGEPAARVPRLEEGVAPRLAKSLLRP